MPSPIPGYRGILDHKGQPTTLQRGHCLIYDRETMCLEIANGELDGTNMRWSDGDNKLQFEVPLSDGQFFMVAFAIAQLHGFDLQRDGRQDDQPQLRRRITYRFV